MVRLQSIEAKDFLCFADIALDLESQGLSCILGENCDSGVADSNGAGKSALFDLIFYALYGKPLRSIRKEDVIRRGCLELWVQLLFVGVDGLAYKVERKRGERTSFLEVWNREVSEEKWVHVGGEDKKHLQQIIDVALGVSPELFRQIVIFGQGGSSRFSELGDVGKKRVVEEILGLDVYEKAAEISRKHLSLWQMKKRDAELLLARLTLEIEHYRDVVARLEKEEREWSHSREMDLLEMEGHKLELEYQEKALVEDLFGLPELRDVEGERACFEELRIMEEKSRRLDAAYRVKKDEMRDELGQLDIELLPLQQRVADISELTFTEICPTCGQASQDAASNRDEELQRLLIAMQEKRDRRGEILERMDVLEQAFAASFEQQEADLRELRVRLSEKENARTVQVELEKKRMRLEGELLRVRGELERCREKRAMLAAQEPKQKDALRISRDNLFRLQKEESEALEGFDESVRFVGQYGVLVEAFGPRGIRSYLFENLLPELNEQLRKFAGLVSGGQISAELSVLSETAKGEVRERIAVHIYNPSGGESYEALSSGERRRLDLPIAFALRSVAVRRGVGMNVVLLDEVFENVDQSGVSGVMDLFHSMMSGDRDVALDSMLVVTHDQDLASMFPGVISVRKEGGGARLVC